MNQQPASNKGWAVTFTGMGINLILGVLYAWGVVKSVLVNPKGIWKWTDAQGALPMTVAIFTFSMVMTVAGRMQDKAGPRITAMFGGLMVGLGLALSYFAHTPMEMVMTFGVLVGIGVGLGYSATTPPALKWFPPAKKGLIAGIVVAGIGLAPVIMAPLATKLIAVVDVSKMFLILGGIAVVVVCILAQLLINPPAGYVPAASGASAGAARPAPVARRNVDWLEMLGTPQFWMLWVIMVLTAAPGLTIIGSIPRVVGEHIDPKVITAQFVTMPKMAMYFVMLVAVFNTLGRLVGGFCLDKLGRKATMVLFFAVQAINMFCFPHYNSISLLIFGGALTGICYGTIFPLFPATTADYYGLKNLGVNYGFVFTAFGIAAVAGPYLAGVFHDHFKNYNNYFFLCAGMLLIGAVLAAILKAPKVEPIPAVAAGAPMREKAGK